MYRLTTTMIIFGLGLGSQLTYAAPPQDVHFVEVHFSDLDLTRSEGAAVLHQRLHAAAETVCTSLDARDLASQMRFKECVQIAIDSAVAKINATVQVAKNQN